MRVKSCFSIRFMINIGSLFTLALGDLTTFYWFAMPLGSPPKSVIVPALRKPFKCSPLNIFLIEQTYQSRK